MNADGSNPRAVFTDLNATALEPAWTPDGNFILVKKGGRGGGEGGAPAGGIWMYHKDGGQGVQIVGPPAVAVEEAEVVVARLTGRQAGQPSRATDAISTTRSRCRSTIVSHSLVRCSSVASSSRQARP